MTLDPAELERIADRALRALPLPRAPRSFAPRVMAAVRASVKRPRTWFAWPFEWQAASVAGLLLLVAALVVLVPTVLAAAGPLFTTLGGARAARAADLAARASVMTTTAGVMWRVFVQPIVGYLFAIVVVMSAGCAAFGALLGR